MSTSRFVKCLLAFALTAIPLRAAGHLELGSPTGVAGVQVEVGIWYRGTTNVMQLVQAGFTYDNARLEFVAAAVEPGIAAKFPTLINFAAIGDSGVTLQLSNTNLTANLVPDTKIGTVTFTIKPATPVGEVPLAWSAVFLDGVNRTANSTPGAVHVVKLFNALNATLQVNEDSPWTPVDLVGKFTNEQGDPVAATVTDVSQPANGMAEVDDDGNVLYRPGRDFNGTDTFTYTATDGTYTDTGTVTVTVTAVSDYPELRTTSITKGPWNGWYQYMEREGLAAIFDTATVVDPDFDSDLNENPITEYDSAVFYAYIENRQDGDELTYEPATVPNRSVKVTVDDDGRVYYESDHIGQIVGGVPDGIAVYLLGTYRNGAPRAITPAVIEALVTDLRFRNDSYHPSAAERTIRVALDVNHGYQQFISHHLNRAEIYFFWAPDKGKAVCSIELETDSFVRSVTVLGNSGATVGTMDQYGNLSGMEGIAGLVGSEGWYEYEQPVGKPGQAEWEVGLEFASWDAMLAAFPRDAGLSIQITYWNGHWSTLDVDISGIPATAPGVPAVTANVVGNSIQTSWNATTGDPNAALLFVEVEGPEIYDEEDEFETMRGPGGWEDTSANFAGLGAGRYEVVAFAGDIAAETVVDDVEVLAVWAGVQIQHRSVGATYQISGTITDASPAGRNGQDPDRLRVDVQAVDGTDWWHFYAEADDVEYIGNGQWTYVATLAPPSAPYTHYIVQAYWDWNNNGKADLGEPHGRTTDGDPIVGPGVYDFDIVPINRSWTREWALLGDAYLYITPVNNPPVNTEAPTVTGTVQYGQTVTANPGEWNDDLDYPEGEAPPVTDFAYQWYVADDAAGTGAALIDGQTGETLELVANLVGKFIAVDVTATDQGVGEVEVPSRNFASATARSPWVQVAKAPLTVTADAKVKTYGAANPTLTYTITGFVLGDNEGVLAPGVTIGTTAVQASPVGDYPINVGTEAADALYDITFVNATLAVNQALLTVTADDKAKTYGDANPTFTVSYDGFVLDQDEFDLGTRPTADSAATANSGVGTYDIVPAGGVSDNYAFAYVNGTLTVDPRPITVTAAAKVKTYGEADPDLTHALSAGNIIGGDAITGSLTRVAGENVGTYQIQQGSVTAGGNYALTYVPADLTINQAPLLITANDASRNFFQPNSAIPYSVTYSTPAVGRTGLVGGDTPEDFAPVLEFSTDAVDGSPHGGAYYTRVRISGANLAALPASNYDIAFADGVLTIEANAPTRNAVNSAAKPLLVVSGRTTQIDLSLFFDDLDKQYGDQLVFSDLGAVTGGNGNETIAFLEARAAGIAIFNPNDSVGGENGVDLEFTVKVQDSADPVNPLDGTADGVATIYLRLIDNQAPVITAASPAMDPEDVGADVVELIDVDEDQEIQVSVTASDETDPSGDDGIASIAFAYSWDDVEWTNLDQPARTLPPGPASATSAALYLDHNTVSFAEGTKPLHVRAVVTDGMGVVAVKRWLFTVHNVNLPPTLDDIDDVEVMEDNENNDVLTVLLTGVSNGGETNDPAIQALLPDRVSPPATITATTDRPDIIDSIALAEVGIPVRANGDMQTFELTYTLAEDANGVATITVTVDDGSGYIPRNGADTSATIDKTFTITVNPVNDPPVNTDPPSIVCGLVEGTAHVGRELHADPGAWNDDKDLDWVEEVPTRTEDWITYAYQWQVASDDYQDYRFEVWEDIEGATEPTFVPTLDQNGRRVRVQVTATDSGIPAPGESAVAYSAAALVDNEPPTFAAGATITIYGFEDNFQLPLGMRGPLPSPGFDFTLDATDPDDDVLAWSVSADPYHGTAEVDQNGNVTYRPDPDYYNTGDLPGSDRNGGESFQVMVDDGLGGTATIAVQVVVVAVNDAPEITSLRLVPRDGDDNPVSISKTDNVESIEAVVEVFDVDDDVFTYDYQWTVERRGFDATRAAVAIHTGATPRLTVADLAANGLGNAFVENDKVTVTVTVTDSGGGQLYDLPDLGLPRIRTAVASRQALLGSPAWFPQVPVDSLLAENEVQRGLAGPVFYEITFALDGVEIVSVVVKTEGDKDYPISAEYMAAVWPQGYEIMGLRSGLTYEVTRVRKFLDGIWVNQDLAPADKREVAFPTVVIEDYDPPTVWSDDPADTQDGSYSQLERVQKNEVFTGDYRATFDLESVGGYHYSWVGPGTHIEDLVVFDTEPDGTFPTSRDNLQLLFGNITTPGQYILTVTPRNPESQFVPPPRQPQPMWRWRLDIDQAEIDENRPGQAPPVTDNWGMTPGWDGDGAGGNLFSRANPEYVGTMGEGQVGVALTLAWNMVPDAQQYYLLLSNAAGVPIREYNRVPVGRLPRVPVFLGAGTYQWRVAAVNAAGNYDWSGVAWIQVLGVGDEAQAIADAENRTPYVEDGAVATTVNWGAGRAVAGATLEVSCTIKVAEAGNLDLRVYLTRGSNVVFDQWVSLSGSSRLDRDHAVAGLEIPGLILEPNGHYALTVLPRNEFGGVHYIGPWSQPTLFGSGAPGGQLNFSAVTGPTFVANTMTFDFSASGIAGDDIIEHQVSMRRNGVWTDLAAAQMTGADVAGGVLTLPTAVQAGDGIIIRMRVRRGGVWTEPRIFWGVAP